VLFPFARARVSSYLTRHGSEAEVKAILEKLMEEHVEEGQRGMLPPPLDHGTPEAQAASLVAYIHWLIEEDRKSTPLKALQGKIWEEGYRSGELRGELFTDVPQALARWHAHGKTVSIYSSGSTLAQKLLFSHTVAGDLTEFIDSYFDTHVGPKTSPKSYTQIAAALHLRPAELIFISDVTAELDASHEAGMKTFLCLRPGNSPQPNPARHVVIESFNEVCT
jgi:enolase-phosphatase E1